MQVQVRNLHKSFGNFQAVRDASFQIESGQLVGLLGPSGSGKTSVLRMLAGLEKSSSGEIYIDGRLSNNIPVQRRGIGVVFQNYALFKHMNVFRNVAYGLKVQKKSRAYIRERVSELLHLMGLESIEEKYPHQLSGGQRQRVAFARALAPEPGILLLDEPFSAIDAKIRKELRSWLRNLINEFGITSIFVTHDQDEAIEVADEIIIMNEGTVEQQGGPWEIYNEPASRFVASFIGESNFFDYPVPLESFPQLAEFRNSHSGDFQLMIRPEAIQLKSHVQNSAKEFHEEGRVSHVHFRGDSWYIEIELEACKLFTYQPIRGLSFNKGEIVYVLIDQLTVFSESGHKVYRNEPNKVSKMV